MFMLRAVMLLVKITVHLLDLFQLLILPFNLVYELVTSLALL